MDKEEKRHLPLKIKVLLTKKFSCFSLVSFFSLCLFALNYRKGTIARQKRHKVYNCHLTESIVESNFTVLHSLSSRIMKMNGKVSNFCDKKDFSQDLWEWMWNCEIRRRKNILPKQYEWTEHFLKTKPHAYIRRIAFWTISQENHSFLIQTINNFPVI